MRKILMVLALMIMTSTAAFAAKIPDNVTTFVDKHFPGTTFRFDGVVILPDNTIYLPLFPAKLSGTDELTVRTTIPSGQTLKDKPYVVIFSNEFVLLKIITDENGQKTFYKLAQLPPEIKSGLLPQDMLVPKGLVIPENMKGIIGNLNILKAEDPTIKVENSEVKVTNTKPNYDSKVSIPKLKDKVFYTTTNFSRNISAINSGAKSSEYSLAQKHIPIDIKVWDDRFLLVTSYGKKSLDIISLQDDQIIKQIEFKTQPDQIVIDKINKIAYVSSSEDSSLYVVNLESMTLSKQIKISGMCEKITLSDDGTKLFYFDKKGRDIWVVELDNNYLLKEVGKFPNISKIAYVNGKIYIASRTKSRLAIIDYKTIGLISEVAICEKPVDMLVYKDRLFILGAADNIILALDTETDVVTDEIYLNTEGFPTRLYQVDDSEVAIVTDSMASMYTVFDLNTKQVLKTNALDMPISLIEVANKIQKINK